MQTGDDPVPANLICPSCYAISKLRRCGELLTGQPYQQLLVACLECDHVFAYTKLITGQALVATPLMH